jgi:hypothetical protein
MAGSDGEINSPLPSLTRFYDHEMGIQEALTHDQHFVQAGFEALLR